MDDESLLEFDVTKRVTYFNNASAKIILQFFDQISFDDRLWKTKNINLITNTAHNITSINYCSSKDWMASKNVWNCSLGSKFIE